MRQPYMLTTTSQTAIFNFQSLLLCILLSICTCSYAHYHMPAIMDRYKDGYVFLSPASARNNARAKSKDGKQ